MAKAAAGGFTSYSESIDSRKIRGRSQSFLDHFSQAILFYRSQSKVEQQHIKEAFSFELSKCTLTGIRKRMVNTLAYVDLQLAAYVAEMLGLPAPARPDPVINGAVPADGKPEDYIPVIREPELERSDALSMLHTRKDSIQTRCIAVLMTDGVDAASFGRLKLKIEDAGGQVKVIAPRLGMIKAADGSSIPVDMSFYNTSSVLHDALYLLGGEEHVIALLSIPEAIEFIQEQYGHCKILGATPEAAVIFTWLNKEMDGGIIGNGNVDAFIKALAQHRFWNRTQKFPDEKKK
ncbi:MAG: DJ-1/PfpI family protein [Taibaiella sp.]|nr:DJ-1/PfpI family protein [Taibaiella sp.]